MGENTQVRFQISLEFSKIYVFLPPQAALLLRKQLAELNKNPVEGFSAGLIDDEDIFRWEVVMIIQLLHKLTFILLQVLIIGPPDTLYEGGFFKCHLIFPREYPLKPPVLRLE